MNTFCVYTKNHPKDFGYEGNDYVWSKCHNEWRWLWTGIEKSENIVILILTDLGHTVTFIERL